MTSGIYLITNNINHKQYVGQSINIEERCYRHSLASDNCYLHNAIKKYGWNNFSTKILEECPPDKTILNQLEKYYIQQLNTLMPNGYNMTQGGDASPEHVKKSIKQFDLEGVFIQEFPSIREAGQSLNIDPRYISDAANRKGRNTTSGFQWCFPGEEDKIQINPKTNSGYNKIPVCQYNLKGQYIKTIESINEAARQVGIKDTSQIKTCCETQGNYSAGGYMWRYSKDFQEQITPYNSKKAHSTTSKKVIQFDKKGNKIAEYDSAKDAEIALNMKKGGNSAILRVCQGKQKTSMGYIWKYGD